MKKTFLMILLPITMGIIFAGCSFEEIFSKLATSDVEAGAKEAYTQSKIIEAKQATINQKKQEFQESVALSNVNETNNFIGYAFKKNENNTTTIEVEAMLTNAGIEMYEVWLRGATAKDVIRLGVMTYNQTDDYSFTYTSDQDVTSYKTILITREASPDDSIETIVMAGGFQESESTSPASTE